ncbi:MAG: hypothetical protein AAF915_18690 [Cyanobacteria bacterium P01_D01_bin.50]
MSLETEIITQRSNREISPNIQPNSEVTIIQIGLAALPVAFVIILAFIFIKQVKHRKNLYNKVATLKRLSAIPCHTCRFFANNQELPCAVQPTLVMSLEAFNCCDYMPKKSLS